jgi:hypothetical protein
MDDKTEPPLKTVVDARVEIEFTHYTAKTSRYRVLYDGQSLIESTDDPEYDACRALLAKGITGTFVTYSLGCPMPRARVDIEKGAKLMILETDDHGPKLVPYVPFPVERFAAQPISLTPRVAGPPSGPDRPGHDVTKLGRPSIGELPMTGAERVRRHRAKKARHHAQGQEA